MDVINPSTGLGEALAPAASAADVDDAVAAMKSALPAWSAPTWDEPAAKLRSPAAALGRARCEILHAATIELGKTDEEAGYEPDICAYMLTAR